MVFHLGDPEARCPRLAGSKDFTAAAQPQVLLGDQKAVIGLPHDVEPRLGRFPKGAFEEENTGGRPVAAADTSAQLVKLGKAEPFGMLDNHDGRVGNIDPDLDHRGRHQNTGFAPLERAHGRVFFIRAHAPVYKGHTLPEHLL